MDTEEKVYYKDDNVKVTDLRITCNHVTIPIERISHYTINLRANNLLIAFTCFMLSFILVYVGVRFFSSWGYCGFALVILSFIWVRIEYSTYVELFISAGSRKLKLLDTGMGQRDYLYRIADALSEALLEKEKSAKEKEKEKTDSMQTFSPSDTMKLKKIIMSYDKSDE